ncbi:MAG: hypothetical protein ACRCXM_16030 [Beijerinckiaceae bacterium]
MFRLGFGKKNERDTDRVNALKSAVRQARSLGDDVAVSINEIACADPACPVLETIILVMQPGQKTRAYKVHGALDALTDDALRAALQAQS